MNRRDWLEETDRQHIELMIGRSLAALAPQCRSVHLCTLRN